jgi:hypothetical protein
MVYENFFTFGGHDHHEVVLLHRFRCDLPEGGLRHGEHDGVNLDWRSSSQLQRSATAPFDLGRIAFDPPYHLRNQ